jgi:hypothetical protein
LRTLVEFHESAADFDPLTGLGAKAGNLPGLGRGHLDHRLFGLDRDQRLIGDDIIALAYMPGDELSLLEAFAEIGEGEDAHGAIGKPIRG